MSTVIDSLLVRLGFLPDPSGARQFESVLGGLQGKVAGFLGFLGSFATIGSFVETASQFEQFEVQLTTIQGSAEKAKESLEWISTFAAKTPYEVAQVTEAFVKLQSYGLNPQANGLLESIGNMASGMGKSLDQAVEAIADAVNGENERLKEFGIKGSKQGAGFEYTYNINGQEFKKQAANNAQDIQKALQEIMDERFKGGMEAMSKTWKGTLSNLSDTWQMFQLSVMDAGVFEAMKASLNEFMIGVVANKDEIKAFAKATGENILYVLNRLGQLGDIAKDWADNMGLTARSGQIFAAVLALIAANLAGLAAGAAVSGIMSLFRAFMMLFSPIGLLGGALIGLFLIFDDLQTFAEGGNSFFIPFLQQSPAVVAALGAVTVALAVMSAAFIQAKLYVLYHIAALNWYFIKLRAMAIWSATAAARAWIVSAAASTRAWIVSAIGISGAWIYIGAVMLATWIKQAAIMTWLFMRTAAQSVISAAMTAAPWIAAAASMLASWIVAGVGMFAAMLPVIAIPALIIAAIVALVAGIYWLYSNWDSVWNGLGEIVANIVGMVTEQWDSFVSTIEGGWQKVEQAWNKAKGFVGLGDDSTVEGKSQSMSKTETNPLNYRPSSNAVGAGVLRNDINSTQVTNNVSVNTPKEASEFTISQTVDAWKNPMRNAITGGVQQ